MSDDLLAKAVYVAELLSFGRNVYIVGQDPHPPPPDPTDPTRLVWSAQGACHRG